MHELWSFNFVNYCWGFTMPAPDYLSNDLLLPALF
jgi:hypothetical protein